MKKAKILLVGPYWGNAGHGAEIGCFDALVELGHEVDIWDNRVKKYLLNDNLIPYEDETNPPSAIVGHSYDLILALGPGFKTEVRQSPIWKGLDGLKILWCSEPIRLGGYKNSVTANKENFHAFFTFDESEIPLYKEIGIDAEWLPQAYNSKWYKPLDLTASQCFGDYFCFIGSFSRKWKNREGFINRVRSLFNINVATIFDAKKVNRAYNMHVAALNLGLYLPELGPPEDLRAEGLQQRIFEIIGAGKICITNEISSGTNQLFTHGENILFYNKDTLEDVLKYALDKCHRKQMEKNILKIKDQHSYKARMQRLLEMIDW